MLTCPAAQPVSVLVLPVTRTGAGASSAGPDPGVRPVRSAAQPATRPPLLAGQRLAHEAGPGDVAGHEVGLQRGQQEAPLAGQGAVERDLDLRALLVTQHHVPEPGAPPYAPAGGGDDGELAQVDWPAVR